MKPRTKIALPLFGLAGLFALFLTGWVAFRLYEITPEMDENLGRLSELRDAFFRIGESVQTNFTLLDAALKGVDQSKPAEAIKRFQSKCQEWKQWLDEEKRLANQIQKSESGGQRSEVRSPTSDLRPPTSDLRPEGTNQFDLVRGELISLLNEIESAYTNYLVDAQYLIANAGQPWIAKRLAEREQKARYWRSNLLNFAEEALVHGKTIDSDLIGREARSNELRDRKELRDRIQHLRLILLLAVVGFCFLSLLGLYRRKQAETSAVLRQHSEQQARLDKLAHFSRLAQEHAHEIKQPLTAMNAHLYTLQRTLAAGSAALKDAAVIRSEIHRLDQIVEKFLRQARPTEAAPVDLTAEQVLGEVRELMAPQLEQEAIEFRYEVERGIGFRADPQQLKQVLINLVKNAAESISPRDVTRPVAPGGSAGCISEGERPGRISLRAKTATRELKGKVDAVALLEVEDTGSGIPVEIQGKIFDPFFSTKKKGSGLGLAISARIIDQFGGQLEFDTRVGEGTIFRIVLPASRKEPTA